MTYSMFTQCPADAVKIIQLTDTHLYADASRTFDGVNTQNSLECVIDLARENHWPPDMVLATGDLAHEPVPAAYERLREIFNGLKIPVYCIPGNHDDPTVMGKTLPASNVHLTRSIRGPQWQIILLDTVVPDSHGGHLAESEQTYLDEALRAAPEAYALICLHHSPVLIGSRFMDEIALDNPVALFAIIDRYPQVRAVLWGHIHQEFSAERGEVRLFGSPSTCVQFKPGAQEYVPDTQPPGYRWLLLQGDGTVQTGIQRLKGAA